MIFVTGHEGSGVIEKTGRNVSHLKKGEKENVGILSLSVCQLYKLWARYISIVQMYVLR